jgi:hypothetical protein
MPEVLSPFQGVAVQPGQDPTGEDTVSVNVVVAWLS